MKKSTVAIIWEYLTGYKNERQQLKQQIEQLEREKIELNKQCEEQQKSSWKLQVDMNVLVADHANERKELNNRIKDLKIANRLLQVRLTVANS